MGNVIKSSNNLGVSPKSFPYVLLYKRVYKPLGRVACRRIGIFVDNLAIMCYTDVEKTIGIYCVKHRLRRVLAF